MEEIRLLPAFSTCRNIKILIFRHFFLQISCSLACLRQHGCITSILNLSEKNCYLLKKFFGPLHEFNPSKEEDLYTKMTVAFASVNHDSTIYLCSSADFHSLTCLVDESVGRGLEKH